MYRGLPLRDNGTYGEMGHYMKRSKGDLLQLGILVVLVALLLLVTLSPSLGLAVGVVGLLMVALHYGQR